MTHYIQSREKYQMPLCNMISDGDQELEVDRF